MDFQQRDDLRALRDMSLVARQINISLRKLLGDIQEPMSNFELLLMLEVILAGMVTVDTLGLNLMTTRAKVSDAIDGLEKIKLLCRQKGDNGDLVSLSEDGQELMLSRIAYSFIKNKDDWLSGPNSPSLALVMSVLLGQNQAN